MRWDVLVCVGSGLPFPSKLQTNLDALVDILGSSLVVDAELEDVAVFDVEWL